MHAPKDCFCEEKIFFMVLDIRPKDEIYLRLMADDVRRSYFIEFLDENRVVVEQTQPIMDNAALMSLIFLTYCPVEKKNQRFGFQARIESITPDHRIIIRQLTPPFICDLRLWPRIHINVLPDMRAFCYDQKIQVVDVSGGGTHLVLRKDDSVSPEVGSLVEIKFIFEKGETTADGKILRLWTDPEGLRHVEVKFIGEPEIRNFIYK
jgi:hypothetical protein